MSPETPNKTPQDFENQNEQRDFLALGQDIANSDRELTNDDLAILDKVADRLVQVPFGDYDPKEETYDRSRKGGYYYHDPESGEDRRVSPVFYQAISGYAQERKAQIEKDSTKDSESSTRAEEPTQDKPAPETDKETSPATPAQKPENPKTREEGRDNFTPPTRETSRPRRKSNPTEPEPAKPSPEPETPTKPMAKPTPAPVPKPASGEDDIPEPKTAEDLTTDLKAAKTKYLDFLQGPLDKDKDPDGKEYNERLAEAGDEMLAAFTARAKARGIDPESDEFRAVWDEYWNKKIQPKIDETLPVPTDPETAPKTVRSRVKKIMATAVTPLKYVYDKAGNLVIAAQAKKQELYEDEEHSRRNKVVIRVAGAVAVAGALYGFYKLGEAHGLHEATENAPQSGGASHAAADQVNGSGTHGTSSHGLATSQPEAPAAPRPETVTVQHGDTTWDILQKADDHNTSLTNQMIHHTGDVLVNGHERSVDGLGQINPGDHISFTLPQSHDTATAAVQHAAANPNVEHLTAHNAAHTDTVSGVTVEHVHHLGLELPADHAAREHAITFLSSQVAQYNHLDQEQLHHLPAGYAVNFPPREVISQLLQQQLDDLETTKKKAKVAAKVGNAVVTSLGSNARLSPN